MTVDGYTVGVEEEYQVVDPQTRELRSQGGRVVEGARREIGEGDVTAELMESQVETVSSVCRSLAEVRSELVRLRRVVIRAAGEGARIVAASTHPFSHWREQVVTPKERYRVLIEAYQQLAQEQLVFGFHVHVGIKDRESAVRVMNRLRVWLASLLALSANSPFWLGEDSGYASYRTQVWGRFPVSGPPGIFASRAEHDALIEALVRTETVEDATKVYWDARLPEKTETIEIRVADVCSTIDEAVMLAGLSRALVRSCFERDGREEPYPTARPEILRAAHWRASRYGLEGELIDVEEERVVPAGYAIQKLLDFARPSLEEIGDWDEVSDLVRGTLEHGNGATRQRAVYKRSGDFGSVVDMLIEETARGT
ncbi:MAG: carboxylate-amine ligase [Actinomycetota bacterium]|nr:carboxylate-amine ligase [Actinomycetota bacterium]MDP9486042.1 carboxylate-amine ligase [Actinomycetota bacterium]